MTFFVVICIFYCAVSMTNPVTTGGDSGAYIKFEFFNTTNKPVVVDKTHFFVGGKTDKQSVKVEPRTLFVEHMKDAHNVSRVVLSLPQGYEFTLPTENKRCSTVDCLTSQDSVYAKGTIVQKVST